MRKKFILALAVLLTSSLWSLPAWAATGKIYVSPASSSVRSGNTVTVALRISPGTAVNTVQATMLYNQADLQWISNSLGAFSTCTQNSGGGGSVTLACAMLGTSTSSDSLIANITFKARVGSGSTSLQLTNANAANNGSYTNPATANGTVSFTAPPAPTPTPTPSPTPPQPSSTAQASPVTSTTTEAKPPAPKTTPKILRAQPAAVEFTTATLTVKTNIATQVFAQYGTDEHKLNLHTALSSAGTTHKIALSKPALTPGTPYFYQIVAKSSDGSQVKSTIASFSTKGYTVSVTVLDSQYRPLAGQTVTLHSSPMTTKTNDKGVATFMNVAPGLHHVEYFDGQTGRYSQPVYVGSTVKTTANGQTAAPQTAAVVLTGYATQATMPPASHKILSEVLLVLVTAVVSGLVWNPSARHAATRVLTVPSRLFKRRPKDGTLESSSHSDKLSGPGPQTLGHHTS